MNPQRDIANGATPQRVLVVDDEGLIRWSVVENLSEVGLHVLEASDGAEALRVLANPANPVDVVLLDYRLPDSNDLTLLAKVRQMAPRAAVIMMTAFGTPDVFERAVAMGAYCVLAKPFDMGELPGLIRKAFDTRPH